MTGRRQPREDIVAWHKRIGDAFAGPTGFVGERVFLLRDLEQARASDLLGRFRGYVCLMDSFVDFYIETLSAPWQIRRVAWSARARFLQALHTVNLWRWRAAYQVFWTGYSAEALSLLRSNLETVLLLGAIGGQVVPWQHVFGESALPPDSSEEDLQEHYERERRKLDRKIATHLLGGLSKGAADSLRRWRRVLHGEVHRSSNEFLCQVFEFAQGTPVPIFPAYDEDRVTQFTNSSIFLAFLTVRTLPLLQLAAREFGDSWSSRYRVLDDSLAFVVQDFPKSLGRAIEELATRHFSFNLPDDSAETSHA